MDRSMSGAFGLIIVGLAGSLGTVVGFAPHFDQIDLRQPEFATVLILVVCGGLVVTGFSMLSYRARRWYRLVPAVTLIVFSLVGAIGSFLVFMPGVNGGLAGALSAITFLLFFFVGAGLVWGAIYWSRRDEFLYPLAVLLSILGIGMFHVVNQSLNLLLSLPLIALVVAALTAFPTLTVHLRRRSRSHPER